MKPDTKYIKIIKAGKMVVFLLTLSFYFVSCEYEDVAPKNINGNKITITTSATTNITQSTAQVGGTLGDTYGRSVQDYGHCWDTLPGADLSDNHISLGSANEALEFSSALDSLTINSTYYIRAYFKIDDFVVYGNEITFNTLPPSSPAIQTVDISDINRTYAKCSYNITNDGGSAITQRGICYGTSTNPDITNNLHTTIYEGSVGTYTEYALGLTSNTTYYIRAYAKNQVGITYGNEKSFKTKE
ncbi:MAG: hypothetical protein JXB49_34120 [Bacteroidales bacterium]|nr:hypothetical protein [Bacteroidales bacterium]